MGKFKPGWYLIYTRPKWEDMVEQELTEHHIISYLPLVKSVRQWHDRKKVKKVPLFSSYIFVKLSNLKDLHECYLVKGFLSFVRVGKQLAKVDQSIIDNIVIAIGSGQNMEVNDTFLGCGEQLMISEGPLTGIYGELIQYNGRQRALVRVQMLGRNLIVDIASEKITKAESVNHLS